jgi:acyl-CoA synthetase (NDP forming)
MPGPRIAVQIVEAHAKPRPDRIEVDVPHQFQPVALLFDQGRFEAVLKQMATAPVPLVEELDVAAQQSLHEP